MSDADRMLKTLVYKACVAATWTDHRMTVDEMRYLAHLSEMLASDEAERAAFEKMRVADINPEQVLQEIAELNREDKLHVFTKCLEVLACDRRFTLQELQFIKRLKKVCGIGLFQYRALLARLPDGNRIRLPLWRRPWLVASVCLYSFIIFAFTISVVYLDYVKTLNPDSVFPKAKCSNEDISIEIAQSPSQSRPGDIDETQVFEHVKQGIVTVYVLQAGRRVSSGSGCVLGRGDSGRTYIITNRHVVESRAVRQGRRAKRVTYEVEFHAGARFTAVPDYLSDDHDLALLAVRGAQEYCRALTLRLREDLYVGQTVYAIGTPLGLKKTLTRGVVSALRDECVQTDATISYGSSGGPLVDHLGNLCAVMRSGHRDQDFNFGIYADAILEMLEQRRLLYADTT